MKQLTMWTLEYVLFYVLISMGNWGGAILGVYAGVRLYRAGFRFGRG